MTVLSSRKFNVTLCMFFLWLRVRTVCIQAWNFQTARSNYNANANARYDETTTKTDVIHNIDYQMLPSPVRRQILLNTPAVAASASLAFAWPSSPALARNMPVSNGADTSKVGTVSALVPIVELQNGLQVLRQILHDHQQKKNIDGTLNAATKTETTFSFMTLQGNNNDVKKPFTVPTVEKDFKRLFDAYSDQVSYKQKFLDQNAFLVYYTNGYDGPGRENLEKDPVNERQTLQFGARNEAWIGWDDFLAEWEYYHSPSRRSSIKDDFDVSFSDMIKYLSNTIEAVDRYLKLSPSQDLEAVQLITSR